MSYITGGNIEATDYNTFSTLGSSMNQVYGDLYPGATAFPNASYGYGISPALSAVTAGQPVTAAQWSALFQAMRDCGTHQGTTVSPPVPAVDPIAGGSIVAENTGTPLANIVTNLNSNRLIVAPGQTSIITGTGFPNPAPWTNSLVYTFQVDFGSWNNARYFFNAGGQISITGTYSSPVTPEEDGWALLFTDNFPVNINWETTTPQGSNLIVSPAGFYANGLYPGLNNAYQPIYQKFEAGGGGAYYGTNYALIEARLANVAGTDGLIDFIITLVNGDSFPESKPAGGVTYTINRIQPSGTIAYPGTYAFTSGGFVAT